MGHYRSSNKFPYCVAGFFLAAALGSANAQSIPQRPAALAFPPLLLDTPNAPDNAAAKQQLQNKIRSQGNVRLIVKLRTNTQAEHLLDTAQLQAQRNAIANMQAAFARGLAQRGGIVHKQMTTVPFIVVRADDSALSHILNSPDVVSVQEDTILYPNLAQSVPLAGGDKAWAAGGTGAGQTIAILDTGVDPTHPMLTGKIVAEACFSTNDQGATPICPNGSTSQIGAGAGKNCTVSLQGCKHGTHVAAIAAGKGSTSSGVAKDANIISIQVFTSFPSPSGGYDVGAYTSDIMKGMEHVYSLRSTYKIAAVNLSVGGGNRTSTCDTDALKPIVDNLRAAGIATVAASGNNAYINATASPACISTVISVGATTKSDVVDGGYSNSASWLTLLAPGSNILSAVPGGAYEEWSGTSMAAPHVAGAIAVLKSKKPTATVPEMVDALVATGKKITDSRNSIVKPRIQVDVAMTKLAAACFKSSNSAHVTAGRAYASWGYAYANGSKQYMGMNNTYTITKLRNTGPNYYVIDSTCP